MFAKYSKSNVIPRAVSNKIPGEFPVSEREKYVEDLSKLNKIQLIDLRERESKLLNNKSQILKLPDKGKKIQDFYKKILEELSQRDEIEKAANLLSDLNITSAEGHSKLNVLEWTGTLNKNEQKKMLDSDDDEDENVDPLHIIAQSRNVFKKKNVKPETNLITQEDLNEINSFKDENISEKTRNGSEIEPCASYLYEKDVINSSNKSKFMPYKTTISNVHNLEKEKSRKICGKHWENTSATPPPIRNSSAQLISLSDSVEIQREYLKKLTKLQEEQALQRLTAKEGHSDDSMKISLPSENTTKENKLFNSYRNQDQDISGSSEEEIEVHDDDYYEKGGAFVSYSVYK